jgi:hypothetical protein
MIPVAFARSQAAIELEDTLKFSGLSDNFGKIREKVKDKVGKELYLLRYNSGNIEVYSDRLIKINGIKLKSVREAQKFLQMELNK